MCVTLHRPLRELMATAFDLGLLVNRTDYVFIFMFIYQVPGENPPEWNQGDAIDLKVKEAFKSMLIIRAQPLNWTQLNNITERIVRRGSEQFNVTYDRNNKLNEFAIGCYETVELLAVVLDRMRANAQHLVTPAAFLPHLRDQTFPLSFRNITFGPDGARIAALVLQKFHRESGTFQDVTKFGLNSRHALGSISYRDVWTGPIPPDRPPCGFNGEHCQGNSMWQFRTTIGVSVGVVVSAVLAATVLSYWHVRQFSPEQQMWWQLDSTQLLLRLWTHWSEWSTQAHRQDTGR
ncbi:hypothetical protein BV898_11017 [Hypsibius exemplaris]|uniref:Receptor ligand binding region domain-containing protein n=1 Tax=Hypsibius exemplaris TaxID=2072580 RepID=A0A1W0WI06_HYPEX|nr:hypothetical protein BV898_11017 [Hypsibius exemplaris]